MAGGVEAGVGVTIGSPGRGFGDLTELQPSAPGEVVLFKGTRWYAEVDEVADGVEDVGEWAVG